MKKLNFVWTLIAVILIFLISYGIDQPVNSFVENLRFTQLDFIFSIITNFGFVVLIMLIVPIIVLYQKNKNKSYLLLLAFILSVVTSFIIKLIFLRQRPNELITYPFINMVDYSFPSMHAAVIFSLLPILIKYLPRQKYFWIVLVVLVAFTRIYFGFHFLSDVVFGALLGYFIGNYLLRMSEKKKLWL